MVPTILEIDIFQIMKQKPTEDHTTGLMAESVDSRAPCLLHSLRKKAS